MKVVKMNTDLLKKLLIICQHDFSKKADVFYSTSKDTIFVMDDAKVITHIQLDNLNLADDIRGELDKSEKIAPSKKAVKSKNKSGLLYADFVWTKDTTWRDCISVNLDPRTRILFSSVPSVRITAELRKKMVKSGLLDAVVTERDYLKEHKKVRVNFAAKKCYSRLEKNDLGNTKNIRSSKHNVSGSFTHSSKQQSDKFKPQFD